LFYEEFSSNVTFIEENFVHNWPTDVPTDQLAYHDCTVEKSGRVFNCGYDTAGKVLEHLLPNIDGSELQPKD
jgi:hypothetical protein